MKITVEEATKIVKYDHDEFSIVPGTEVVIERGKYGDTISDVFKNESTGRFYKITYMVDFEYGECEPFEDVSDDFVEIVEVVEREVVTKQWVEL